MNVTKIDAVEEYIEAQDEKVIVELSVYDASVLRALLGGIRGGKANEAPLSITLHERYADVLPSTIRAVTSSLLEGLKEAVGDGLDAI